MNEKELTYFIEHLLRNHINNNEEQAVLLNNEILLAFVELKIISADLYNNCLELIRLNNYNDVVKAEELLVNAVGIELDL